MGESENALSGSALLSSAEACVALGLRHTRLASH